MKDPKMDQAGERDSRKSHQVQHSRTPSVEDASDALPPLGRFAENVRYDLVSGLLVFLIALPLCLGIAIASGFPAINGVFTAIAGGVICSLLSNSELTIKGPAAGMIAIVLGAVTEFAALAGKTPSNSDASIYMEYLPSVVGVAVVAGVIQILFGVFRAGSLADFFPSSVIHGLLASIGLIIIGKQLYVLLGLKPNQSTEAYKAFLELPEHVPHFAWQVAIIGVLSLIILFLYPHLKKRFALCKVLPPQLIILILAIPAAASLYQGFQNGGREYSVEGQNEPAVVKSLLVKVPPTASKLPASFIFPSFTHINTVTFWKWVLMFTLVGSLESLLSAKAVDVLDPWKRKSDLNRDLLAVGIANTTVACVGGLPMISEIVRSSANRDYGARTRWSNFFHGSFLLVSIIALPFLLNKIPLTALAAMLIYAGCRLAHYKEFVHTWHVGKEQLLIFVSTIAGVLATDLLIGVGIGILVKLFVEIAAGVSPLQFLRMPVEMESSGAKRILHVTGPAVFTNWLGLKSKINALPDDSVIAIDFSRSRFIDHTVITRVTELKREYAQFGRTLAIEGLDRHQAMAHDPLSSRRLVQKQPH